MASVSERVGSTLTKAELELVKLYEEAEGELLAQLDLLSGTPDLPRRAVVYNTIVRMLSRLRGETEAWASTKIEYFIERAARKAGHAIDIQRVSALGSSVNLEAVQSLQTALTVPLANVSDSVMREALKLYRATALSAEYPELDRAVRREVAAGLLRTDSVPNIAKRIRELLKAKYENGLVEIIGKDGRTYKFSIAKYASLVAHGVTRQAMSSGTILRAKEQGFDLVKINDHPSLHGDFCDLYRGRVYSLSGNDPRFPALSEVPGVGGYMHARCRHGISIFVPDFSSEAELDSMRTPTKWLLSTHGDSERKLIRAYWTSK